MKRALLLCSCTLLIIMCCTQGVVAQGLVRETFEPRILVGPTGGVNISSMTFQPSVQQGVKIGYDAGVVVRLDGAKNILGLRNIDAGIWVEVDYSSRGWREVPEEHPKYYYERTLNFINIPVMTHFMVGSGAFKVTVDAGAHFGVLVSEASSTNFPQGENLGVVTQQHSMPVQNKFAWGLGGGLGAEYHFGRFVAGVRGSYVYGLGEIYGNSRKDFFGKSSEQIIAAKLYFLVGF